MNWAGTYTQVFTNIDCYTQVGIHEYSQVYKVYTSIHEYTRYTRVFTSIQGMHEYTRVQMSTHEYTQAYIAKYTQEYISIHE